MYKPPEPVQTTRAKSHRIQVRTIIHSCSYFVVQAKYKLYPSSEMFQLANNCQNLVSNDVGGFAKRVDI